MGLFTFLLVLFQMPAGFEPPHVQQIAPVEGNLNIIASNWVIADLDIDGDGQVKFGTVLKGHEPFRGMVVASAGHWTFTPARTTVPVESHATAVFLFRPRAIFADPAPDLSGLGVAAMDKPPIPIRLSDPGYPSNSVAEGEVILELQVTEMGTIRNVRVVRAVAGLTEFTDRAVRFWRFAPAVWGGVPVRGTVIVVISYLRPAL
jgi:TonB family protein